ncbi:hypothetical protein [Niallia circulans]|uniref:hypothetical protein n=1 Tax=Niallia circulans TaxID=1397 RepID=UPI00159504B6|nr:hypothetical protein [Niallia circulans]
MKIEIRTSREKPIKACEVIELYKNAGWWKERTEKDIEKMLSQTFAVGAWEKNKLIGFARAIWERKEIHLSISPKLYRSCNCRYVKWLLESKV